MKTLEKLAKQKTELPILNNIYVQGGIATASNLDCFIYEPVSLADGLYYGAGIKSLPRINSDEAINDFPRVCHGITENSYTIDHAEFLESLSYTALAMSEDDSRYYLQGVYFADGVLVATDGHRLHINKMEGFFKGYTDIMPADSVLLLISLMKEHAKACKDSNILITRKDDWLQFKLSNGSTLKTRVIDGTFPDYNRVLPNDVSLSLACDSLPNKKDMKLILNEIKIYAEKDNQEKGFLPLTVRSDGFYYGVNPIQPFPVAIDDMVIGFNMGYFKEYAGFAMNTQNHSRSPIKLVSGDKTGVLLPVRL